jgi:type II secretion system protein I
MPLIVEKVHRNSGFSLVEVLAALAIAAALSAALMHTFSNTRHSANRMRELIDMMTLADNIAAQINSEKIRAGRIDGNDRGFIWRSEIELTAYTASMVHYAENIRPDQSTYADNSRKQGQYGQIETRADEVNSDYTKKWVGYHIKILVRSSSGQKYFVETFRIGRRNTDEKPD